MPTQPPAGSVIEFDPTVFATPQTITLTSTLELCNTATGRGNRRPRRASLTMTGNHATAGTFAGRHLAIDHASVKRSVSRSRATFTSRAPHGGGIVQRRHADGHQLHHRQQLGRHSAAGGGIDNGGTLTVTNSTIDGNSAHVAATAAASTTLAR